MSWMLCVDTSTMISCVALGHSGKFIAGISSEARSHGPGIMVSIQNVLSEAGISHHQLEMVVASRGPGTFTGVRIGMTTQKTLSWSLNIPFYEITTFDIYRKHPDISVENPCVLIDARRNECYTDWTPNGEKSPRLVSPLEIVKLLENEKDWFLTGSGIESYSNEFSSLLLPGKYSSDNRITPEMLFSAGWKRYEQGKVDNAVTSEPLYIRPSDAEINLRNRVITPLIKR
ncbi:MAG: tRNA (adenosine(37)-N6)-threonylcarbamoyltransferase complex dimerization subunit type 1 TsaB [Deltaproteobacteria bacterium]|nr:tRNA (adenosine(37)-N6)-threonylcarbamoyltransferase complex dimerization subunit type 1 TsaB [Deltaproteobacteria bacterium]